jgi:hypothetical protein
MKRNEIVNKLIKEGFSEKTLVNFSDKQLSNLSERIFSEEEEAAITADDDSDIDTIAAVAAKGEKVHIKKDTNEEKDAFIGSKKGCKVCKMSPCKCNKDKKAKSEVKETLKGGQKKLDKNHNGKIDGQDFKILKGQKKEVITKKTEEVKETLKGNQTKIDKNHNGKIDGQDFKMLKDQKKKPFVAKKDNGDISKESKVNKTLKKLQETDSTLNAKRNLHFELKEAGVSDMDIETKDINELGEKYSKKNQNVKNAHDFYKRISGKKMNIATEKQGEVKEWVMNLAENKLFHPMTSKGEIMDLIKTKLNESKK